MRLGRVPGDGANIVPGRRRLIAIAVIDVSMSVSTLLPTKADGVGCRHSPSRRDCLRPVASEPKDRSSKSATRSTGIKRNCASCNRCGYAARTSRQGRSSPHCSTEHHLYPFGCFVMSIKGIISTPAEFVHPYNVWVVNGDGASYYESYHYEQIRDFFALEHVLHKRELPDKIPWRL